MRQHNLFLMLKALQLRIVSNGGLLYTIIDVEPLVSDTTVLANYSIHILYYLLT